MLPLGVVLAAIFTIGYFQATSAFPFAFDPYWFMGTSRVVVQSGSVPHLEIPTPFATTSTFVNIGYVPTQSTGPAALGLLFGIDFFAAEQAQTTIIAAALMLLVFALARRITDSSVAAFVAAILLLTTPYVFARWNFFVPENVALAAFLASMYLIMSGNQKPFLVALLLFGGLAFHPRSFIFFAPMLFVAWFFLGTQGRTFSRVIRRMFRRESIAATATLVIVGLPYLEALRINLYYFLFVGATYTLAVSFEGQAPSLEQISTLLNLYIALLAAPPAVLFALRWKTISLGKRVLLIWWIATWLMFFAAPIRNFPVDRFAFYVAVPTGILGGAFADVLVSRFRRSKWSRKQALTAVIVAALLGPAAFGLNESPLKNPWVAWGNSEAAAVTFVEEMTAGRDDFVIFTPEYSLPYGYGLRHVELREEVIAAVLDDVTDVSELRCRLSEEYPSSSTFVIIYTNISRNQLGTRYPVLRAFDPATAAFARTTVWVYELPRC